MGEPCGTDSSPQDGDACEGDTTPRTYCGECGVLSSSSFPTGMSKTPGPPSPTPTPSPTPPAPPAPPPAPTPTPPAPTPGCADVEDDSYCSYVVSQSWCELLSDSCLDSCQCCADSPPDYCSGKEAALV